MTQTLLALLFLQGNPGAPVDQKAVDAAIAKGCAWILRQEGLDLQFLEGRRNQGQANQSALELILVTLAYAGVKESDPRVTKLMETMLKKELTTTYTVSLQVMALQKYAPGKYLERIAQCAQFLVDNQALNGQWDYGAKAETPKFIHSQAQSASAQGAGSTKIHVRKSKTGPPNGDNSNAQYAALGLRAAFDAGVTIDKEVLLRGQKWWTQSQQRDGGWNYNDAGAKLVAGTRLADGREVPESSVISYGSMTAGAVGALCIYCYMLHQDYKKNASVLNGLKWLEKNFDVKSNPKKSIWHLYYLYALERAGILYGTETFGSHEWYNPGAKFLLRTQDDTGAWIHRDISWFADDFGDTCFAILFLKKGTPPLIYSEAVPGK